MNRAAGALRWLRGTGRLAPPWVVLLPVLAACSGWRSRADALAAPLAPRAAVRLWVRGDAHTVHGVRVAGDSLAAVPDDPPPLCAGCALRLALRDVDSAQVRRPDRGASLVAAIVAAPLLYTVVLSVIVQHSW